MSDTRTFRVVDEDGDWYETTGDPVEAFERVQAERDGAYRERAHLVALLAAQYPSTWGVDPEWTDWHIVYVELPTGQASWHVSPNDVDLFPHVFGGGSATEVWDGHSTEEKYRRIDELTSRLHAEGGIEAVGGHRGER